MEVESFWYTASAPAKGGFPTCSRYPSVLLFSPTLLECIFGLHASVRFSSFLSTGGVSCSFLMSLEGKEKRRKGKSRCTTTTSKWNLRSKRGKKKKRPQLYI